MEILLWHKPWSGGELYLPLDKGILVSQDHSLTSFTAHELISFRSGELARPVSIVGKVLWESRKIINTANLPCNFLILKEICPYHRTMPRAVWHTSIGMNVFTWFLLLLRSFVLLGANPFSFQFSETQYFFWQDIWYPCSPVIPRSEPSHSSIHEVWMRGARWRTRDSQDPRYSEQLCEASVSWPRRPLPHSSAVTPGGPEATRKLHKPGVLTEIQLNEGLHCSNIIWLFDATHGRVNTNRITVVLNNEIIRLQFIRLFFKVFVWEVNLKKTVAVWLIGTNLANIGERKGLLRFSKSAFF